MCFFGGGGGAEVDSDEQHHIKHEYTRMYSCHFNLHVSLTCQIISGISMKM